MEVLISQSFIWLGVAVLVIVLLVLRLRSAASDVNAAKARADHEIAQAFSESNSSLQSTVGPLLSRIEQLEDHIEIRVREKFGEWQASEIDAIRHQEADLARRDARQKLDSWRVEAERDIRAEGRRHRALWISGHR